MDYNAIKMAARKWAAVNAGFNFNPMKEDDVVVEFDYPDGYKRGHGRIYCKHIGQKVKFGLYPLPGKSTFAVVFYHRRVTAAKIPLGDEKREKRETLVIPLL